MMEKNPVFVDGLVKQYEEVNAVDGISFSVEKGDVFGLVGPNGAGKTTTLKILSGLITPTSGVCKIDGIDVGRLEMKSKIGFLPEESTLYEEMSGVRYLKFFADLYRVDRDVADERIEKTLDRLDLDDRNKKIEKMSKGMRRKIAIARSLINDPEVLIYDEAASGLDPVTTNNILKFIRELAINENKTIVFSAHNLYDVESICDRVAILRNGKIRAIGSIEELREEHGKTTFEIFCDSNIIDGLTKKRNNQYSIQVDSLDELVNIRDRIHENGGSITHIRTENSSLEDMFLEFAEGDKDEN